jgi:hypothetical protein
MTIRDQLPIEPLSPRARARIKEGVFAALDQGQAPVLPLNQARRRKAPFVAAAGVVLCAAAALLFFARGSSTTEIATSRVVTGSSPSEVRVGDALIVAGANSALTIRGDAQSGVLVILESGQVRCSVQPRGERPPFRVQAADVLVEVVGTEFTVERQADDVEVSVSEGKVRVTHRGATNLLTVGARWSTHTKVAAATEATDESDPEEDEPAEEPEPDFEIDDTESSESPGPTNRRRRAKEQKKDSTPPEPPAPEAKSAKELYMEAAALEASSSSKALSLYRKVVKKGGPWAANALFAQARLEIDRGRHTAGKRLLKEYLRRYPKGANASLARKLLRQ